MVDVEEADPHDVVGDEATEAVCFWQAMLKDIYEYIVEEHEHEHCHLVLNRLLCGEDIPSMRASKGPHRGPGEASGFYKPLDENVVHQVIDDVTKVGHEAANNHLKA